MTARAVAATVAVLGAGAGGAAAVAELTQRGLQVHLWNRSAQTLGPFVAAGGVRHEGVLGSGLARPRLITPNLREAVEGADLILVCLPTFSHDPVARELAALGCTLPVVLNPGHTGGALEFRRAYLEVRSPLPPVAEFSTLTYVARKREPDTTVVSGKAETVRVAALPGGERALQMALALYPTAVTVPDVLASGLSNVNMVLHCPGAVLAAAWVEATGGDFTFYVQGMTAGVARVMARLDAERLAVAAALGHALPGLVQEMQAIGTVARGWARPDDLAGAIAAGEANRRIRAPDSFAHRYYREDFGHGLLPFTEIAAAAGVPTPVADALYRLARAAAGTDFAETGRTARRMGFSPGDKASLLALVRG